MSSKKVKCKAPSPAESHCPAPSRPVSPVYQAANRCDTPDQGYFDFQYAMEHCGSDSSSELEYHQEEQQPPTSAPITEVFINAFINLEKDQKALAFAIGFIAEPFLQHLSKLAETNPQHFEALLLRNPTVKQITAQAVSDALAAATPQPPPPPTMAVDSPSTLTGPKPPGAMLPTQGNHKPLAAPTPRGGHAPSRNLQAASHPPPPPTQAAPKPSYAAVLGTKAPCPRKAHPPTKLVAPASTKWVVIPTNKSQLRDAAKCPLPHHIVGAINCELHSWAGEFIGGVQIANLGDAHILAASWVVGANLLITAAKTRDNCSLATPTYSTIVNNALFTIPASSNVGTTVISYQPAARLQIKGLPTWDPSTNRPVELTLVYQTLDSLGIFKGVELIKNGPAPSDALSWARNLKTFNAELCPCTVTVRFHNNDSRETGALLKKAFYLLGRRCRFDKWQPRPPPPKKR
ncbi:hypothetical protein H0H81_011157 [Sphagnurus paluster]|uniref:Uncharacterized protein n=1 Tax=Sphagnurus paluster TaxID=117069 RepID=A0A9P7FNN4_9AGAR|nr:hypothetical protein H0H81_011157 [Sphagnurus paluster]